MIAVISYGAGNTGSVLKAAEHLGMPAQRAETPEMLTRAEKIILPGQGHFGAMMSSLAARKMIEPLRAAFQAGKPFLGICLGLQALYEGSDEAPDSPGLGILSGRVKKLDGISKIPHVGWSPVEIERQTRILAGVEQGSYFYYCHSYYGPLTAEACAVTEYGARFPAAIETGNICAVQFHPEKSGQAGLRIFRNFLEM